MFVQPTFRFTLGAPEVKIRAMHRDDVTAVQTLEREIFGSSWQEEAFHNELSHNPTANYLVLEDDQAEIVGYCGFWLVQDEAHVTSIALHPRARGQQWGKRLMHAMVVQAEQLGALWMTLEVRHDNTAAQQLYRRFGFARVGVRPKYYEGRHDAWIMWAGNLKSQSYRERLRELASV